MCCHDSTRSLQPALPLQPFHRPADLRHNGWASVPAPGGQRMTIDRRAFLMAGAGLLAPRTSRAATARIEVIPDEQIGVISPDIYGHFTEHLGGCIYDGIWV